VDIEQISFKLNKIFFYNGRNGKETEEYYFWDNYGNYDNFFQN